MKLSICIPIFNSETLIEKLATDIGNALSTTEFELVLVSDGSTDNSDAICSNLAKNSEHIKFIALQRNFGEHNAVMCALNYSTGDIVIVMDDDFQNPPSEILKLANEISKGKDVVYSKYLKKNHSLFRNLGSQFNNKVATWLLGKPSGLYLSSFKAINRSIVEDIIKYKGPFPYIDGLIWRLTNNIGTVIVTHNSRLEGHSNYTFKKLISLWLNMFINFSIKPLRVFTASGFCVSIISMIFLIYLITEKILHPEVEPGWASLMSAITFFSGLQIIFLGVVAEYVGKNYLTVNGTPQWIVKSKIL